MEFEHNEFCLFLGLIKTTLAHAKYKKTASQRFVALCAAFIRTLILGFI